MRCSWIVFGEQAVKSAFVGKFNKVCAFPLGPHRVSAAGYTLRSPTIARPPSSLFVSCLLRPLAERLSVCLRLHQRVAAFRTDPHNRVCGNAARTPLHAFLVAVGSGGKRSREASAPNAKVGRSGCTLSTVRST